MGLHSTIYLLFEPPLHYNEIVFPLCKAGGGCAVVSWANLLVMSPGGPGPESTTAYSPGCRPYLNVQVSPGRWGCCHSPHRAVVRTT